ncbi:hypothetical protein BG000_010544 [Podila horticola]|nr:hypothetical protein BG000_010544 [Podila horticola]
MKSIALFLVLLCLQQTLGADDTYTRFRNDEASKMCKEYYLQTPYGFLQFDPWSDTAAYTKEVTANTARVKYSIPTSGKCKQNSINKGSDNLSFNNENQSTPTYILLSESPYFVLRSITANLISYARCDPSDFDQKVQISNRDWWEGGVYRSTNWVYFTNNGVVRRVPIRLWNPDTYESDRKQEKPSWYEGF